jgi:hypothetical protein
MIKEKRVIAVTKWQNISKTLTNFHSGSLSFLFKENKSQQFSKNRDFLIQVELENFHNENHEQKKADVKNAYSNNLQGNSSALFWALYTYSDTKYSRIVQKKSGNFVNSTVRTHM